VQKKGENGKKCRDVPGILMSVTRQGVQQCASGYTASELMTTLSRDARFTETTLRVSSYPLCEVACGLSSSMVKKCSKVAKLPAPEQTMCEQ